MCTQTAQMKHKLLKSITTGLKGLKHTINEFRQNNGFGLSAELAFWFFYSIFPFLIFLFALAGFLPFLSDENKVLNLMREFLPSPVFELIGNTLVNVLVKPRGFMAIITLGLALWASSNAVGSMMGTLNRIHGVKETRPYWKVKGVALLLTMVLSTVFIFTFLMLVLGPVAAKWAFKYIKWSHHIGVILWYFRFVVASVGFIIALLIVYRYGPDIPRHTRYNLPGAIFAVSGGLIASHLFGLYLQKVAPYNKFYGALGTVIAFMTWLYVLGGLILLGGQLNSFLLRKKSPAFEARRNTCK